MNIKKINKGDYVIQKGETFDTAREVASVYINGRGLSVFSPVGRYTILVEDIKAVYRKVA